MYNILVYKKPEFNYKQIGVFGVVVYATFFEKNNVEELSTSVDETSEKTSEKIIEIMKSNNFVTISELSELKGITERSIERNIKKLQKERLLKRIGPDKGGSWQVIKKKVKLHPNNNRK